MAHIEHLRSIFSLEGRRVVDVGAGDGVYSRQLNENGAKVSAVEIDSAKVAKARSLLPPDIDVLLGSAERLPLEDSSQQLTCFFFSLHHVPMELHDAAFTEVCRVSQRGARLHVVEPYPFGSMFDVVRLVEDETIVRTNSHKVLGQLDLDPRFRLHSKNEYVLTRKYPSFDHFLEKIVQPDPERLEAFGKVAEEMERTFESAVEKIDGALVLHQPCAAFHFIVDD